MFLLALLWQPREEEGMERHGKGWTGVERDGKGWKGMEKMERIERDRKGWKGLERDGKGWKGEGKKRGQVGTPQPQSNIPPFMTAALPARVERKA